MKLIIKHNCNVNVIGWGKADFIVFCCYFLSGESQGKGCTLCISSAKPLVQHCNLLILSHIISSLGNTVLLLNYLSTLTCILSGHKAQSLPLQLQISRKPFKNAWSSCRVSCFQRMPELCLLPGWLRLDYKWLSVEVFVCYSVLLDAEHHHLH